MRWPYKKSPPITYEMLQLWPANSCCCFFSWAETLFSTRYRNLDTAFELQRRSGSISNLGAPICSRPHWSHIPCPCDSSFQIPDSRFQAHEMLYFMWNIPAFVSCRKRKQFPRNPNDCDKRNKWGIKVQAFVGIGDSVPEGASARYIWLPIIH